MARHGTGQGPAGGEKTPESPRQYVNFAFYRVDPAWLRLPEHEREFVVAVETGRPGDFLDLVMELRGTEASRFTLRDTPTLTCLARSPDEALDSLG